MIYAAIDPGKNSAVAIIIGDKLDIFKLPEDKSRLFLNLALLKDEPHIIGIEKVHAIWGAGAASTFTFGSMYGYWLGVLDAFRLTPVDITTKDWQETMTNKPEKPKTKGLSPSEVRKLKKIHKETLKMESFRAASEAFPKVRFPSHDVTDSVNMARWLRHIYKEKYEKESKESKKGRI